jgi:flavorubredoxin
VVGSYGWGGKAVEQVVGALTHLKVELLEPVLAKGTPDAEALAALERLADDIAARHAEIGAID